jgi:hypothetical protein
VLRVKRTRGGNCSLLGLGKGTNAEMSRLSVLSPCHLVMYTIAMIQALVFDFDGLLVGTETPAFESWRPSIEILARTS